MLLAPSLALLATAAPAPTHAAAPTSTANTAP